MGLAVVVVLIVIGSVYTYSATVRLTAVISRLVTQEFPAMAQLEQFRLLAEQVHVAETHLLSEERPSPWEFLALQGRLAGVVREIRPLPEVPVAASLAESLQTRAQILLQLEQQVAELYLRGDSFEARQLATEAIEVRRDCLDSARRLLDAYKEWIHDHETPNVAMGEFLQRMALALTALSVVVAILLIAGAFHSIVAPLRRLMNVVEAITAGNLEVRAHEERRDEIGRLAVAFNLMVDRVQSRLEEIAEKNRALQLAERVNQEQLRLAQHVQTSIVPKDVHRFSFTRLELFCRIHAARFVGGDFYDVHVLDEAGSRVGLVVGDASGSGVPAALVMILTVSVMREASRQSNEPRDILERVNRGLREHFAEESLEAYVTSAYVLVDLAEMKARFSCAGHEPPLMRRACDGRVVALAAEGLFLASFEDGCYAQGEVAVEAGDKIMLYTDGLTESRDPEGEFFGCERLQEILGVEGHLPCGPLGELILQRVAAFRGDPTPRDDIALLIAEVGTDGMIGQPRASRCM